MNSWKGKPFSIAGKEVLLKFFAQAIPTYTMSIYHLCVRKSNEC